MGAMLEHLRRMFASGRGDPRGTTPTEAYRHAGPDELVETEGVVMAGPAGAPSGEAAAPSPAPRQDAAAGADDQAGAFAGGETAPAHEWTSGYDGDDPVRREAAERAARAVETDEAGGPTARERERG